MIRFFKYINAIICCCILLTSQTAVAEKMTVQLDAVNKQITAIQKNLSQEKIQHGQLEKSLRKTEITISQLTIDLRNLEKQLSLQTTKLSLLKQQQALYEKSLQQQQTELAAQIRLGYVIGQQDYLKLMLNQQDPADMSRNLTYFKYFNRGRIESITSLNNTLKSLQENQTKITGEAKTLAALKDGQKRQQQQLQQIQQSRQQVLDRLNTQINTNQQQLDALISNKNNLQNLIKHLQNEPIQNRPTQMPISFAKLKGALSWPTEGTVILRFDTPIQGSELTSSGVLIKAPEGQSVYAIYPGRVMFADWLKGFGLLTIIDHGNGYMSLYGRNQSVFKKVGQNVNAGDLIAQVGESGGFDQSALYFEIRYNGQPVNPEKWCK